MNLNELINRLRCNAAQPDPADVLALCDAVELYEWFLTNRDTIGLREYLGKWRITNWVTRETIAIASTPLDAIKAAKEK